MGLRPKPQEKTPCGASPQTLLAQDEPACNWCRKRQTS